MEEVKGFLNSRVHEVTELNARQIVHWTEKGLVTPAVKDTRGAGYKRKYSYLNLIEFALCKELFEAGFTPYNIKNIIKMLLGMKYYRQIGGAKVEGLGDAVLVFFTGGKNPPTKHPVEYFFEEDMETLFKKLNKRSFEMDEDFRKVKTIFIVNLLRIKNDVDNKLKELGLSKEGE